MFKKFYQNLFSVKCEKIVLKICVQFWVLHKPCTIGFVFKRNFTSIFGYWLNIYIPDIVASTVEDKDIQITGAIIVWYFK